MNWQTVLVFCRWAYIFAALLVIAATALSWVCATRIEKAKGGQLAKLSKTQDELGKENAQLNRRDRENREQIGNLVQAREQLASQNAQLSPQIEKQEADLRAKGKRVEDLEVEAKKASRGISSTYDFNGARRVTTRPGHISVSAGPEVIAFGKMTQLRRDGHYEELASVCEKQIKETPDWLTPHLFLGVARMKLGQKEQAARSLRYVLKSAPDDPAYAEANDLLKQLEER